jgi:pyridoxine/pyridoxamine 5'-phosphate oxidase
MRAPAPSPAPAAPIAAPAESLPASLAAVQDAVWDALARGVRERWSPWSLPTLATVGPDGAPQARVIALRGADRAARTLTFHTDARSDKVAALAACRAAAVTFFDPADAVEARFTGRVAVHRDDPVARACWNDASALSKSAAAIALAPGTPLAQATPFERLVQEGSADVAYSHFAALVLEIESLDWLWLGPRDLRRARFAWGGRDGAGQWVVP